MKTKDLNYLEAVKELKEGRCERIEAENGCQYEENPSKILRYVHSTGSSDYGINLQAKVFLGKWKLIGVKPQTEKRTIKYWLVIWEDGHATFYHGKPIKNVYDEAQLIIPLSHTYDFILSEEE